MQKAFSDSPGAEKIGMLVVMAIVTGLVAFRSAQVPLTHDEAASFFFYIDGPWYHLFNFNEASNHFLNLVLERLAVALGGPSEVVLRLPALVGCLLFLWYTSRSLPVTKSPIRVGLFVLLVANPYVLDFFSVARGYGLALGCLAAALYHGIIAWRSGEAGALKRTLVWAALATGANFSFLNAYLGFAAVFFLRELVTPHPGATGAAFPWKISKGPLLVFGGAVLFVLVAGGLQAGFRLIDKNEMALPVQVILHSKDGRILQPGLVGRLPPRTPTVDPLAVDPKTGAYTTSKQFFKSIVVLLNEEEWDSLTGITVSLGDWEKTWPKSGLAEAWELGDADGVHRLASQFQPPIPSRLPPLKEVLNWGGDLAYGGKVLTEAVTLAGLLALVGVLLLGGGRWLIHARAWPREGTRVLLGTSYLLLAVLLVPLVTLRGNNALYFGGRDNFLTDTVGSLVSGFLYQGDSSLVLPVAWFCFLWWGLSVFWVCRDLPQRLSTVTAWLALVLGILAVSQVAQFHLLKTPFLWTRTALLYCPIFGLFSVSFLFDSTSRLQKRLWVPGALVLAAALVAALHLSMVWNLTSVREWKFDAGTRAMLAVLDKESQERPTRVVLSWIYGPVVHYELTRTPRDGVTFVFLEPGEAPSLMKNGVVYDYFYGGEGEQPSAGGRPLQVVHQFPESETRLLKAISTSKP